MTSQEPHIIRVDISDFNNAKRLSMITHTSRLAVIVCNEQNKDIKNLKYENKKLQERIKLKQGKYDGISVCKFIATDAKLRLNTGLPNKDVLNALYNHFSPNENRCEWKDEAEQEQERLRPVRQRAVGV